MFNILTCATLSWYMWPTDVIIGFPQVSSSNQKAVLPFHLLISWDPPPTLHPPSYSHPLLSVALEHWYWRGEREGGRGWWEHIRSLIQHFYVHSLIWESQDLIACFVFVFVFSFCRITLLSTVSTVQVKSLWMSFTTPCLQNPLSSSPCQLNKKVVCLFCDIKPLKHSYSLSIHWVPCLGRLWRFVPGRCVAVQAQGRPNPFDRNCATSWMSAIALFGEVSEAELNVFDSSSLFSMQGSWSFWQILLRLESR